MKRISILDSVETNNQTYILADAEFNSEENEDIADGLSGLYAYGLNKKEWECLAGQLDEEAFEECVNDTLKGNVFEKQELVSYLKKYRDLTGHEYSDIFRRTGNYDLTYVFHLLCEMRSWMELVSCKNL